jgi:hypothetical protein
MRLGALSFAALVAVAVVYRRRQLSDLTRVIAGIVILGLLVYGSGLVHPPNVETFIRDVTGTLGAYTYALVGGLAFLETGAGVGLVALGELAVIFGGVSAGHREIELIPLIAIVWACALPGDLTSLCLVAVWDADSSSATDRRSGRANSIWSRSRHTSPSMTAKPSSSGGSLA